ncbi:Nitrogen permease regulator 2 [Puccinia graminis f. sp. tritici]|uniref:Nitrogen permease regulator 2 n=1 Tax=Puccinia graminis f. sp. tritici TaxID=56615 RepID=A0A5B0MN40_PUCGR|nr:Nitrogen permease regulator 2 [Puccinia graminis f. sp. tritici]
MSGRLEPFKQAQDYLPRLKAVFFGRWDEDKGCEITYQVPENSIRVTSTAPTITPSDSRASIDDDHPSLIDPRPQQHQDQSKYLFEFTDVIDFILPKKHLCGHLVTVSSGSVKILGFPTLIEDEEKYDRNFFMFNLCFVFDKDSELLGYEPIVRKTGRVLRSLEEKNSLLSTPNNSRFEIKSILEELFEELNSFSEVSISLNHQYPTPGPASASRSSPSSSSATSSPSSKHKASDHRQSSQEHDPHSDPVVSSSSALFLLNLKLFPFYGNPPKVEDWNVPISLVSFLKLRSEVTWDLTMFKLVPFIDGTATVRKISRLADVDIYLTRECIQHLVFFGCCIITDPFRFSNSYKLIGGTMLDLLGDSNDFESIKLQEELKDYILTDPAANSSDPQPPETPKESTWNDGGGPDNQAESDRVGGSDNQFHQSHYQVDHNDDVDELFLFNRDHHRHHHHHPSSHSISNLLNLYNEFKSGITVHDWMEQNQVHELNIDVRRFISFGTIKGFLKRVNCYPIWALHPDLCPPQQAAKNTLDDDEDQQQVHELRSTPLPRSQSFTRGGRQRGGRHVSHRMSSSNIRQPAWLAVLKRLNHPHPLLSPPISLSHELYFDPTHPAHPDDAKKTPRKKPLSSRKSTLVSDPQHYHHNHNHHHHHHHHHNPTRQNSHVHHHHLSVAVQVPKDLPLKLNGAHHLDELCVEFKISLVQLEQILRYIDTLSLEEITLSPHPSSIAFTLSSAMQTIYY